MKKGILIKALAVAIILLFIGTNAITAKKDDLGAKSISNQSREQTVDWWPMFHHDFTHSGYSTSFAPNTNQVTWVFQTDMIILSCPIVVDEKVFFGSNHKYYCLDAKTGETIWECTTSGWAEGNPAVDNGKFYAVSRDQYGENKIFCLDASTGNYLWNYTNCFWPFNPVIFDGNVYFGSLDGYIRCLNALDGSFIWGFSTASVGTSNAPAVSDGKVYCGAGNGNMYCLDASTGDKLWNYTTGDKIMESPSVSNGKVYFGSADYSIYCLDAETGQPVWTYATGYVVDSTPAIAYGKIYIGSRDQTLYCLDADTGAFEWSFVAYGQVDSSPAVADGKVYVGSDDGNLYCLNAETGIKIWEYMTGSLVASSPAIANGKVYVGSYDFNVYCFGGGLSASFTWSPQNPTTNQVITFNASLSYDPDGSVTLYEWDWDNDGVYEESHSTPIATYSWPHPGSHPVTLRVTGEDGGTNTVTKTISVTGVISLTIEITGGFGVKGTIKNNGTLNATNVEWRLLLAGGLILLGKSMNGTIASLAAGASETIKDSPVIGFGKTTILVEASCAEGVSATQSKTGIILLFFVLGIK
jgi:outer membrane protein assembly factor BamB